MSRYTKADLRRRIEEVNAELKVSGSNFSYELNQRNGGHAIDFVHHFDGKRTMIRCLDCMEPPRKLAERLEDDYEQYLVSDQKQVIVTARHQRHVIDNRKMGLTAFTEFMINKLGDAKKVIQWRDTLLEGRTVSFKVNGVTFSVNQVYSIG